MNEEWRDIAGSSHQISSIGRLKCIRNRIPAYVGKILSPAKGGAGYFHTYININGKQTYRLIHRLVAEVFLGPCPDNHEVNHINGVKLDNRVENLEYVTSAENQRHAIRICLKVGLSGESCNLTKLTPDIVRKIRTMVASGMKQSEVADSLHLKRMNVNYIVRRLTWKHIE